MQNVGEGSGYRGDWVHRGMGVLKNIGSWHILQKQNGNIRTSEWEFSLQFSVVVFIYRLILSIYIYILLICKLYNYNICVCVYS